MGWKYVQCSRIHTLVRGCCHLDAVVVLARLQNLCLDVSDTSLSLRPHAARKQTLGIVSAAKPC